MRLLWLSGLFVRSLQSMGRDLRMVLPFRGLRMWGLPTLLRRAFEAHGAVCGVVEVHSTRPKDLRILDGFDAPLAAGRIHVHDSVRVTPFIQEMREWRPGTRTPDDGLDAVAGCLLSEPVRVPRNPQALAAVRRPAWPGGGRAYQAHTTFDL